MSKSFLPPSLLPQPVRRVLLREGFSLDTIQRRTPQGFWLTLRSRAGIAPQRLGEPVTLQVGPNPVICEAEHTFPNLGAALQGARFVSEILAMQPDRRLSRTPELGSVLVEGCGAQTGAAPR